MVDDVDVEYCESGEMAVLNPVLLILFWLPLPLTPVVDLVDFNANDCNNEEFFCFLLGV